MWTRCTLFACVAFLMAAHPCAAADAQSATSTEPRQRIKIINSTSSPMVVEIRSVCTTATFAFCGGPDYYDGVLYHGLGDRAVAVWAADNSGNMVLPGVVLTTSTLEAIPPMPDAIGLIVQYDGARYSVVYVCIPTDGDDIKPLPPEVAAKVPPQKPLTEGMVNDIKALIAKPALDAGM